VGNRLIIVCPFSCKGKFSQHKYGEDSLFLTYSGAVFQHQEYKFASIVKPFILREGIYKTYIVNDTSCGFITGIIQKNKLNGLKSEKLIEELYIDNHFSGYKSQPLFNQQYKSAELNIKNQINNPLNSNLLGTSISEFGIEVKGLISSRKIQIKNK
jgi:hypothetical protein